MGIVERLDEEPPTETSHLLTKRRASEAPFRWSLIGCVIGFYILCESYTDAHMSACVYTYVPAAFLCVDVYVYKCTPIHAHQDTYIL